MSPRHADPFVPEDKNPKVAILTLSEKGRVVAGAIQERFPSWDLFLHADIADPSQTSVSFHRVIEETKRIFARYQGLVYIMPTGVVVRAIAPLVDSKLKDPAVVVLDVAARHCISLLSGHEGGANDLCMAVANCVDAEPMISTTTEAERTLIAGVGCRKGTSEKAILEAIATALARVKQPASAIRLIATADVKENEPGLKAAAKHLGRPLRIVPSATIRTFGHSFRQSDFVKQNVNLPAVAEPSAMLAGRRTTLLCSTVKQNGVTVALALENSLWSASAPATPVAEP